MCTEKDENLGNGDAESRRYRGLIDKLREGIAIVGADETVTFANPAACRIFGLEPGKLVGCNLREFVDDEQWQTLLYQAELRREGDSTTYELTIRRPDGERRIISVSASPEIDSAGVFTGSFGLIQDITDAKETEAALVEARRELEQVVVERTAAQQESEEQYHTLQEDLPVGVFRTTPKGRFFSVNPAFVQILGYGSKAEMLAVQAQDIYADLSQRDALFALLEEKKSVENFIVRALRKDGSQTWLSISIRAALDADGNILHQDGICIDITKRKEAEEKIIEDSKSLAALNEELNSTNEELAATNEELEAQYEELAAANQEVLDSHNAIETSKGLLEESQKVGKLGTYLLDTTAGTWTSSAILDDIFGISAGYPKDVQGWIDLLHHEEKKRLQEYLTEHVLGQHKPFDLEYRIIRASDGAERWVHGRGELKFSASGDLAQMVGTIQDITERKQAENALRESEGRYRVLVDNSPSAIVMHDGERFLFANQAALDLLGADSFGQIKDIAPLDFIHPDGRTEAARRMQRLIDEGIDPEWNEVTYQRLDGSEVQAESKGALVSFQGKQVLLVIANDISHRKQAEEALQESEQRFRAYFEQGLVGMAITSPKKGWLDFNDAICDMFGYPREELFKLTWEELTHPEDLAEDLAQFNRTFSGEIDSYSLEKRFFRKDGSLLCTAISVSALRKADGEVDCFLALVDDITERRQAEDALKESEDRFKEVFYSTSDALLLIDGETFVDCNDAVVTMLGYSDRTQFLNTHPSELSPPTQPDGRCSFEKAGEMIALAMEHGFHRFEWEHRNANGTDFPVEVTLVLVIHKGKRLLHCLWKDLTEEKQSEGLLKQARDVLHGEHARFSAVMDSLDALVYVADIDTYELLYINAHGRKIWGDNIGKKCWEVLQSDMSKPCDFCTNMHLLDADGEPNVPYVWEVKNSVDGQWYQCHDQAIRWPDGRMVRLEVATDVTERKQAEENLRVAHDKLEATLTALPDLLFEVDAEGRIFDYRDPNIGQLYTPPESFMGELLTEILPEPTAGIIMGAVSRAAETEKSAAATYSLDIQGQERWFEISVAHSGDANAPDLRLIGLVRDITDRKQAEAERLSLERQVLQAQKLESLGIMAGGIAHDFNNLLMVIMGNADLALDDLSPLAPAREYIKEIETAAKRAAGLAKQMLAYSGKGKFTNEVIRLNGFVQEMAHLLEVSISKKAVLKFNFAASQPTIVGDATQVRQIIMNLIINASEAVGEQSGVISISTGLMDCNRHYLDSTSWAMKMGMTEPLPEGSYAYFEVADTGCGMDQETLEKIFDPFFTTKFTGRGLGLAAVQGIVRGHNGALNVYSEVGKGTTIKVLFPVPEDIAAELPGVSHPKHSEWTGSGTILIADDEKSILAVGKRMLVRIGFEVLIANDGKEAVKVFRAHKDDIVCVLLDLTMPRLDGHEAFREMRAIRPAVKVLLCSGYNEQEATQRFMGKGLAGFIQKPYTFKELIEKLRLVVDAE